MPNAIVYKSTLNRPNLTYSIRHKGSSSETLSDMVSFMSGRGSGIVYVLSKKESVKIAKDLCAEGIKAAAYNSEISDGKKTKVLSDWIR